MSYGGVELEVEGATLTCLKPAARSRSSNWNERRWRLATGSRTEGICSVSGYRFSPSLQLAMITAWTGIAAPSWSSPAERAWAGSSASSASTERGGGTSSGRRAAATRESGPKTRIYSPIVDDRTGRIRRVDEELARARADVRDERNAKEAARGRIAELELEVAALRVKGEERKKRILTLIRACRALVAKGPVQHHET